MSAGGTWVDGARLYSSEVQQPEQRARPHRGAGSLLASYRTKPNRMALSSYRGDQARQRRTDPHDPQVQCQYKRQPIGL